MSLNAIHAADIHVESKRLLENQKKHLEGDTDRVVFLAAVQCFFCDQLQSLFFYLRILTGAYFK